MTTHNKTLRKYHYVLHPTQYEMSCDKCNGINIWWSEYEGYVWCYDCEIDTPGNAGIFDGPISFEAMRLLGIRFDRVNLETGEIEVPRIEGNRMIWEVATDGET